MPKLELDQQIIFNVDKSVMAKVVALAIMDGVTPDAWFRHMVDDLIKIDSRHMKADFIEIKEVPKEVFDIIEMLANSVHPLRNKARACLDAGLTVSDGIEPEPEVEEEPPKKRGKKKEEEPSEEEKKESLLNKLKKVVEEE